MTSAYSKGENDVNKLDAFYALNLFRAFGNCVKEIRSKDRKFAIEYQLAATFEWNILQ